VVFRSKGNTSKVKFDSYHHILFQCVKTRNIENALHNRYCVMYETNALFT